MDLVFFGSGAFGVPTLAALCAAHRLCAVVTQPDRPAGRGGRMTPTPVAAWTSRHAPEVPLLKVPRVNAPEAAAQIRSHGAHAWVVIAFGQKLGRTLLDGVFAINLHASLLPRWRGAAPINAAILAGDAETGNSVITLADRMDAGEVLAQSRRRIEPGLTAGELHDLLAADGPGLVLDVLGDFERDRLTRTSQVESMVTIAPKLSKDDGWVDWSAPASDCRRRVHGLTPWPGVTAHLLDRDGLPLQPLKLLRAKEETPGSEEPPGTLVDPSAGIVACGGGSRLRLVEVQPPGKRSMTWEEFARGRSIGEGARFAPGSRG